MKPTDLDIVQWQNLVIEAAGVLPRKPQTPLAMRCENSQLTTGWHLGGFTLNGFLYAAFCPRAVHGPCAMLAVREDFLKWVTKRLKEIDELHNEETKQGELGL